MRKFFVFLFLAAAAAGIVWYESQPTTVEVPVDADTIEAVDLTTDYTYDEETTTSQVVETTEAQLPEVSFDSPDVTLIVQGASGDDVRIREVFGSPQHIDALPDDVRSVINGCSGVTDRDMVVQVDTRIELTSDLPAEVYVDYRTNGYSAAYGYSAGTECDDGFVRFDLHPSNHSTLTYWVALRNMVTPDHPDGDLAESWWLNSPMVTLPGASSYDWSLWGPRVVSCGSMLADRGKIWLAGASPATTQQGCEPIIGQADALGSM